MARDNYGKIFTQMYRGSMYGAGSCVFAIWPWIIANKDESGRVEINAVELAHIIGDPVERIEQALDYLRSPDPRSRTKTEQGKRLIQLGEFEHQVVNHELYNRKGKDRTDYWRKYRAQKRKEAAEQAKNADVHSEQSEQFTKRTHVDVDVHVDADVDENKSLKQPKESPLFDLNNFETWAKAREQITAAWPGNRTIQTLMGIISGKILRGASEPTVMKNLRDICETVMKPEIENPAGLFNTKCHDYFKIKRPRRS